MQNKNRGAAMVEFALVAPFFFMLVSCIIYGAMVMHDINNLNEVTRAAARYGAVQDSGIEQNDKKDAVFRYIQNSQNLFLYRIPSTTGITIITDEPVKLGNDDATGEKAVKVTITAQMKDGLPAFLFLDYFPESMKTISSSITMRRED